MDTPELVEEVEMPKGPAENKGVPSECEVAEIECRNFDKSMRRRSERLAKKKSKSLTASLTHIMSLSMSNPFNFLSKQDNDAHTLREAKKEPDWVDFVGAMKKEVESHGSNNRWNLVQRDEIKSGSKAIKSTWSFKRKRDLFGGVLKHKARMCTHRGMQKWGKNYWETYSPVVNWITARLMLAINIACNLESRSIDFIQACVQADIQSDARMDIPYGFGNWDGLCVLKLKSNLYGLCDAGIAWFKHLKG